MKIPTVIEYQMTYSFGRYPVIDDQDIVVGVVTNGDVILHILERLGSVYLHNKIRDEILLPDRYLLDTGKADSRDAFEYVIDTTDYDRAGEGSTLFKRHLIELGLPAEIVRRASISLYEAEVNVVIHASGKGEIRADIRDGRIFITVTDQGPGIENIELAMQPGYSTATDEIRARGWGAGMGLANIKKYTDKLVILSSENGVKLEMVLIPDITENKCA
jgi:anti-sigma regulatory factor (Ser/Thr protein kinase)